MSHSRILLILTESLANPVVRSQALRHAAVMHGLGIAEFEIAALGLGTDMHRANLLALEAAEQAAGCRIRPLEGLRPAMPGAARHNAGRLLARHGGGSEAFGAIHARTDYAALVALPLARSLGVPLIWDCRGDAVAETEYGGKGPAAALRRLVLRRRQVELVRRADRAIFVSRPLRAMLAPPWPAEKPAIIAPCAAEGELFRPDAALRDATRARLGLAPATPLLLYAGGLAPYQHLPETIAHFRALHAARPEARLLMLTPDRDAARAMAGADPAILVDSVANNAVNAYLNAADAAYLLRAADRTNRVASPTKFAEYGLAGLPIIMSRAIEDCAAAADEAGNRVDPAGGWAALDQPRPPRESIAAWFRSRYTREGQAGLYARIYAP
ncbi:MAG: hypothetical protein ACK4YX_04440 [Rhabdaerophilum calidifontis]